MKKIGIIHPSFNTLGGAENHIMWCAKWLSEAGFQVTILSLSFSSFSKNWFHSCGCNCQSLYVPFIPAGDYHLRNLKIMGWRLRPFLSQFDVINVHNFPANLWFGFATKFTVSNGPKALWTCHEPFRDLHREIMDAYSLNLDVDFSDIQSPYRRIETQISLSNSKQKVKDLDIKTASLFSYIMTNSRFTASHIQAIYGVTPSSTCFGIPRPLKQSHFHKSVSQDLIEIAVVSRIEFKKNMPSILVALNKLFSQYPDYKQRLKCTIVGEGSYEDKINTYCKTLGIEDNVAIVGFVSEDELKAIYRRVRFVMFLPFDEPLGFIPIEAALQKTPTIGSSHGGPSETIIDGKTGYLVDPLDTDEIVKKIHDLIENDDTVIKMGEAAYTYVKDAYDMTVFCKQFRTYLEELS